jgi:hypothetical protein
MVAADKESTSKDALRITNQFRSKGGMAYDLKCEGVRLALHMVQRASNDDPDEWRIEARGNRMGTEAAVVVEWGKTRGDALRAVGAAWNLAEETLGLRVFDWDAVAKVLDSVRAFG